MSLISPNFDVKWFIFSNFGQGPFPKIAGKSTDLTCVGQLETLCVKLLMVY